ncbi:MAG: FAD:protein FMN transferase, partial [Eudoraea sp.]|nr:FAD:protein FMN transferase [Eudoraea sp.]MBT8322274.1 FAD:protein FMN transferase [Eudoraea sp.]
MVAVKRTFTLMGSPFEITVVASNEDIGYINIQEAVDEIKRIERMISSWDPDSETSLINQNAGVQPVRVSHELFHLLERCVQISEITNGAFDITYAALDGVWRFDGTMAKLPSPEKIRAAVSRVGYHKIELNREEYTVFLPEKGMKIAFGAIGKGYAADRAKELLLSKQVSSGFINAAGDVTAWGTKANGEKWLIGVANPLGSHRMFTWVPLV